MDAVLYGVAASRISLCVPACQPRPAAVPERRLGGDVFFYRLTAPATLTLEHRLRVALVATLFFIA
jgi:hypothetical protein